VSRISSGNNGTHTKKNYKTANVFILSNELSDYGATIVSEVGSLETYRSVALLLTMSSSLYFEALLLLLFFLTTRIEELNFWWEILQRKLSTTSNDGKFN